MTQLLERALERVRHLSPEDQDWIATDILAALDDEDGWSARFAKPSDRLRRMAQRAIEEDDRGETLSLDDKL